MSELLPEVVDMLSPCPFCGGLPRWCKDDEHECHLIICTGCAISIDFQENPDTETVQELRDIMVAKWNKRVQSDRVAELERHLNKAEIERAWAIGKLKEGQAGPHVHGVIHDRLGWICSVCHGWNHSRDKHCTHTHMGSVTAETTPGAPT